MMNGRRIVCLHARGLVRWASQAAALLLYLCWALLLSLPTMVLGAEEAAPDTADAPEAVAPVSEAPLAEQPAPEEYGEELSAEQPVLLFGDPALSDERAALFLFLGDGFTAEERDLFFENARRLSDTLMAAAPFSEARGLVKIYGLFTPSPESGARGEHAATAAAARGDGLQTAFGASFWTDGLQRLVNLSSEGYRLEEELRLLNLPAADWVCVLVNSRVYGGSGGRFCVSTLHEDSSELLIHELGHTIGGLGDEYDIGVSDMRESCPNTTTESDPARVKWAALLGAGDTGVYPYADTPGWYRPSQSCKMQYLGAEYQFCSVCRDALLQALCRASDVPLLQLADYGKPLPGDGDLAEYLICRRANMVYTAEELQDLTIRIFNDGGALPAGAALTTGDYRAEVSCTLEGESVTGSLPFSVEDGLLTLRAASKVYDGAPAEVTVTADEEALTALYGSFDVTVTYSGSRSYTMGCEKTFISSEPPILPGTYRAAAQLTDETGKVLREQSAEFTIRYAVKALSVHDDGERYPGASEQYNERCILILGEGYTAAEEQQFYEDAAALTAALRGDGVLSRADLYLNYRCAMTVSEVNGLTSDGAGNFFGLGFDGRSYVNIADAGEAAELLAYYEHSPYYVIPLVLLNGSTERVGITMGRTAFVPAGEQGFAYGAEVLTELLCRYRDDPDRSVGEAPEGVLMNLYLRKDADYVPVVESCIKKSYTVGETLPAEAAFFAAWTDRGEIPAELLEYTFTWTAADTGEQLPVGMGPTEPGDYILRAELMTSGGYRRVTLPDGDPLKIPPARGAATVTIMAADNISEVAPGENGDPEPSEGDPVDEPSAEDAMTFGEVGPNETGPAADPQAVSEPDSDLAPLTEEEITALIAAGGMVIAAIVITFLAVSWTLGSFKKKRLSEILTEELDREDGDF